MPFADAATENLFRAQAFRATYRAHMVIFVLLCCTLTVGVFDETFGWTASALLPMGVVECVGRHVLNTFEDQKRAQSLGSNTFVVLSSFAWWVYVRGTSWQQVHAESPTSASLPVTLMTTLMMLIYPMNLTLFILSPAQRVATSVVALAAIALTPRWTDQDWWAQVGLHGFALGAGSLLSLALENAARSYFVAPPLQPHAPLPQATAEQQRAIWTELQQVGHGHGLPQRLRRAHIAVEELTLAEELGAGSFGTVVRGAWRGTPVAVKRLHRHLIKGVALRQFKAECELLLSLRHPNIVQLLGGSWRVEDATVCMVLEYCAGGSLSMALADPLARLTWRRHRLPIAQGVARAMAYLHGHEPPVLHRDLKPENILLDETRAEAKLADFGLSREWREDATMSVAGTPLFSAPELLRRERYNWAADVWSYGCVLSCLTTRSARPFPPSAEHAQKRDARRVSEGELRPHAEGVFAELVAQCARADVDERPRFAHVLSLLEAPQMAARAAATDEAEGRAENKRPGEATASSTSQASWSWSSSSTWG